MAKVAVNLASAFTPGSIPNMVFHVDARSGVYFDAGVTPATDGQTVRQWNDASGQANNAGQATEGLRPTYRATGLNGLPSVQFASARLLTGSFLDATFDTAATLFYIGSGSGGTPISADEWGFSVEERYPYRSLFYSDGIVDGVAHSVGVQADAGNYRCCGLSYDGATWRTMMNGHLVKWTETGNLGLTGALSVGAMSVMANYFTGTIGEVCAWRHGATDAQMRRMSAWLFNSWGLAAPTPRRTICYAGDSITFDYGTPASHYPGMIELSIGPVGQSHNVWALAGASLSFLSDLAAEYVDRFVDTGQTLRINTVFAGTNDLAGVFTTAQNVYDLTTAWVAARKAAGWHKVIVFTILPRTAPGDDPNFETKRQSLNTMLRANWATFADGLADVAANTTIGEAGDELNLTYYEDGIHPTEAGHVIIAGILQPVIEGLL